MATKPTKIPTWNSGGSNNTEPTSGQKIAGWAVNDVPPSSTFNWLQKLTGEWAAYLDDGDFTEGITVTGGLESTGAAGTFGVRGNGGSGDGGHGVEGYGSAGGGNGGYFESSFNAYAAVFAQATAGGGNGVHAIGHTVAGLIASNSAGAASPAIDCRGTLDFDGVSPPGGTVALKNKVTALLVPRAVVVFSCNGTASPTVYASQNVTSVTQATSGGSDGQVDITFAQDVVQLQSGVQATVQQGAVHPKIVNAGTGCQITFADEGSTTFTKTAAALSGVAVVVVTVWGVSA